MLWSKHTEDFPKSPFESGEIAILNIETKKGGMIFQKEDCPSINFYKQYGVVEVETRKNNIIFSLRNVETIEYDPNECNTYYN